MFALSPTRAASGSNGVDDTADLQELLDGAGEVVFRKGGTWRIDARTGLSVRSDTRLIVEPGATLQVIPNASGVYKMLKVHGVSNVTIEGQGSLLGDLDDHTGTTGEHGHLINVEASSGVRITGPLSITKAWGDGIYVGGGSAPCRDIDIDGVFVDDCRREGIAVFYADHVRIHRATIRDTGKTALARGLTQGPASGIDVEPNAGQHVDDLDIDRCVVRNAQGPGFYISENPGTVTNLLIRSSRAVECGRAVADFTLGNYLYRRNGFHLAKLTGARLYDIEATDCGYDGVSNGQSGGVYFRSAVSPLLRGATLRGNGRGLYVVQSSGADISQLTVTGSDTQAASFYQADDAVLTDFRFLDNNTLGLTNIAHLNFQDCDRGEVARGLFRGTTGTYWLDIRTAGADNAIRSLTGRGTAPASGTHRDQGARTALADAFA